MISQHRMKVAANDGNVYWYLPGKIILPTASVKYWSGYWLPEYNLHTLAYRIYGSKSLVWLIMAANDLINPWSLEAGDTFRILLPKYLSEVVVE